MSFLPRGLVAGAMLLAFAGPAHPRCGDRPGDADAVAAVRGEAETRCDCAGAPTHMEHVRCVAEVANAAVRSGRLPWRCRLAVLRCASRSTCGRPGAVACCRTKPGAEPRYSIRR